MPDGVMRKYELIAAAFVFVFCLGVLLALHVVPRWRTAHWIELLNSKQAEDQQAARKALAAIGKAAVPVLVEQSRSPEPDARASALEALGELRANAASAIPVLLAALQDPYPRVRG